MKSFEGKLIAQNIRVGIVAARFNEFITSRLLGGAMDALLRHDVSWTMFMSHGCRERSRYRWPLPRWPSAAGTMPSSAWEL